MYTSAFDPADIEMTSARADFQSSRLGGRLATGIKGPNGALPLKSKSGPV